MANRAIELEETEAYYLHKIDKLHLQIENKMHDLSCYSYMKERIYLQNSIINNQFETLYRQTLVNNEQHDKYTIMEFQLSGVLGSKQNLKREMTKHLNFSVGVFKQNIDKKNRLFNNLDTSLSRQRILNEDMQRQVSMIQGTCKKRSLIVDQVVLRNSGIANECAQIRQDITVNRSKLEAILETLKESSIEKALVKFKQEVQTYKSNQTYFNILNKEITEFASILSSLENTRDEIDIKLVLKKDEFVHDDLEMKQAEVIRNHNKSNLARLITAFVQKKEFLKTAFRLLLKAVEKLQIVGTVDFTVFLNSNVLDKIENFKVSDKYVFDLIQIISTFSQLMLKTQHKIIIKLADIPGRLIDSSQLDFNSLITAEIQRQQNEWNKVTKMKVKPLHQAKQDSEESKHHRYNLSVRTKIEQYVQGATDSSAKKGGLSSIKHKMASYFNFTEETQKKCISKKKEGGSETRE